MKHVDILVIGQGLAGSILALNLIEKHSVLVVDNKHLNSASIVAGGILNPITGKRIVKTEDVETLLPFAVNFYKSLEEKFNQQFFTETEIIKICDSQKSNDVISDRYENKDYKPYLGERFNPNYFSFINNPFGSFTIKGSGYLNIPAFLNSCRDFFIQKDSYSNKQFNHNDLAIENNYFKWNNIVAKKIVFCEGYKIQENPWFNDLALDPIKGDILTVELKIELENQIKEKIINQHKWVLPAKNNITKIGSTYNRKAINSAPSEAGKNEILNALMKIFKCTESQFSILEHKAGVRLYTKDLQPIINEHTTIKNMYAFNGFGSKGTLSIPYLARNFAQTLQS